MKIPMVTFSGQSLRTLPDADLHQLLLRDDLPNFLMTMYHAEADYRMHQPTTPQEICNE